MCFLRDLTPEDAMKHYEMALPYREMIVGIGLYSNENNRPPLLFDEVYRRVRKDGFKLTYHCDVTEPIESIMDLMLLKLLSWWRRLRLRGLG